MFFTFSWKHLRKKNKKILTYTQMFSILKVIIDWLPSLRAFSVWFRSCSHWYPMRKRKVSLRYKQCIQWQECAPDTWWHVGCNILYNTIPGPGSGYLKSLYYKDLDFTLSAAFLHLQQILGGFTILLLLRSHL